MHSEQLHLLLGHSCNLCGVSEKNEREEQRSESMPTPKHMRKNQKFDQRKTKEAKGKKRTRQNNNNHTAEKLNAPEHIFCADNNCVHLIKM